MTRCYGWAGVSTPEQAKSEKESIPAQRRDVKAAAERLGVTLIDILEVPGFSRDYIDFHEMKLDMANERIDAFVRLERLWQERAIDLFICRDADRFGRTLAILTYISAQLVNSGARLYLTAKNLTIDRQNHTTLAAIFGLMAEDEVTRLKARYDMGMNRRFQDGLYLTAPPPSHEAVVVDGEEKLILDKSKARLWEDIAELLIQRLPFDAMSEELVLRGHRSEVTGGPIPGMTIRRWLSNPYTWGHSARGWKKARGPWCYDESIEPPKGVKVSRNRFPPVYTGELAQRVQTELRRRRDIAKGRARPNLTHKFSGLLVCAECGYALSFRSYSGGVYVCTTHYTRRARAAACGNVQNIPEPVAVEQVAAMLGRWIALPGADLPAVFSPADSAPLDSIEADISTAEEQLRKLIRNQASAPDTTLVYYEEQIALVAARLDDMRAHRAALAARIDPATRRQQRVHTRDELAELGVAAFFVQPDAAINQKLYTLIDPARFVVLNGEIVGLRTR